MSRSKLELFVNPFPTFIVLACVSFQVIFGFELNVYLFQVVSVDFLFSVMMSQVCGKLESMRVVFLELIGDFLFYCLKVVFDE